LAALAAAVRGATGPATKFAYAFTELDDDRSADALVLLTDREYCDGTGCALLVLRGTPAGFSVVSRSLHANQPVKVSMDTRQGWRELLVWVRGAPAQPHFVRLRFGAGHYPADCARAPAANQDEAAASKTVLFTLGPPP